MHRIWEVDVLRGTAVVLMIVFHFIFDVAYLGIWNVNPYAGGFLLLQRTTAFLFLSLVGLSLFLSHKINPSFGHAFNRFSALAAVALFITLATSIYPGNGAIIFGIIHFIAVSMVFGWFFLKLPTWVNAIAGIVALGFGTVFNVGVLKWAGPFSFFLGLPPIGFYTLDYYSVLPWFGFVLIGIAVGKRFYKKQKPLIQRPLPQFLQWLNKLGKNALTAYIIHQPILFALLLTVKTFFGLQV